MSLKIAIAAAAAVTLAVAAPASAAKRHHRHDAMRAPVAAPRAPHQFYPNEIEGGVAGNLPFNNQIRKMKDPLNANGAGK